MFLLRALFACLLLVVASTRGGAPTSETATPAWFLEHLAHEMEHGGVFLADNRDYRGANEPMEAYGLEWRWGVGRQSLRGRLYGLVDGKPVGDFWEMRLFWHPAKGEARLTQYGGDGTVGEGWVRPLDGGGVEMEQDFFAPDGRTYRVRHETEPLPDGGHVGRSFDFAESGEPREGEWKPRRSYLWEAVVPGGDGTADADRQG